MLSRVHCSVDAVAWFEKETHHPILRSFRWNGCSYRISDINYVHRTQRGQTLYLCYVVSSGSDHFSIRYDTQRCQWMLEAVFVPA